MNKVIKLTPTPASALQGFYRFFKLKSDFYATHQPDLTPEKRREAAKEIWSKMGGKSKKVGLIVNYYVDCLLLFII